MNVVDRIAVGTERMNLKNADMTIEFAVNDDLNSGMIVQIECFDYMCCYTVLCLNMRRWKRCSQQLVANWRRYKKMLTLLDIVQSDLVVSSL